MELKRETTDCIKGAAAILIMLHHISFNIQNLTMPFKLIWYIAFPIVGLFFFFSGYGLYCGLQRTPNYWEHYLSKRVVRVAIPYCIVAGTAATVQIIWGGAVA